MSERTVRAALVVAILALLGFALAQSANASPRSCGDVTRAGHTAYTITTNGTCLHAREVVARYITHTHAGVAGQVRHSSLTHTCSWKLRQCRYQGKDRVIRWKWTVPYQSALASWYGVEPTASGHVYEFGFASLILPMFTRVEFCKVRCQVGIMDDHGPYVAGRTFDLRPNLKAAIGCGDLCVVRWRIVH